jgi:hypothetical protein
MYILPAFGYAIYGFQKNFTNFTPYIALVVSLAPADDKIGFRDLKGKTVWQRLTFITGVTLAPLQEPTKRDDLFKNGSNLIVGFGYKFSHIISINAGALVFKKEDPNPFITTKKVTATPYVSFSLNLKLKTLWDGFTNLIPTK